MFSGRFYIGIILTAIVTLQGMEDDSIQRLETRKLVSSKFRKMQNPKNVSPTEVGKINFQILKEKHAKLKPKLHNKEAEIQEVQIFARPAICWGEYVIPAEIMGDIIYALITPSCDPGAKKLVIGNRLCSSPVEFLKGIIKFKSNLTPILQDLTNLAQVNKDTRAMILAPSSPFFKDLLKKLFFYCNQNVFSTTIEEIKESYEEGHQEIMILPHLRSFLSIAQTSNEWQQLVEKNPEEALETLYAYKNLYLVPRNYSVHNMFNIDELHVLYDIFYNGIIHEKISPESKVDTRNVIIPLLQFALECAVQIHQFDLLAILLEKGANMHEEFFTKPGGYYASTNKKSTSYQLAHDIEDEMVREKVLALFNKY